MIKSALAENDFEPIKLMLEKNSGLHCKLKIDQRICYIQIESQDAMSKLYMYVYPDTKFLVISVLDVEPSGNGTGQEVIKWIKAFAQEHAYRSIKIRAIESDVMRYIAIKHGFVHQPPGEDYVLSLEN